MRKILTVLILFVLSLALWGTAEAKPTGFTTINLRACIDAGDGACQSEAGDVALDDVTVCLRQAGQAEQCFETEDGEMWIDSLPHGSYWARGLAPSGYQLVGITCTTFPNIPYSPCQVRGNEVHFVVLKSVGETVGAVTVNFLLSPS